LVLASGRRIQARCKDLVKVIVRFLRKGYIFSRLKAQQGQGWRERERGISYSPCGKWEQKLNMVKPISWSYTAD
jgi:hypothetical protein